MNTERVEAMAWAVNCPAQHECDFLVFHDPQEAEIQAEQWNEDHDEGENPHKVIPLYPAADSASGERRVVSNLVDAGQGACECRVVGRTTGGEEFDTERFVLQPGEELVVRKVRTV